jgi:hypothetical protein
MGTVLIIILLIVVCYYAFRTFSNQKSGIETKQSKLQNLSNLESSNVEKQQIETKLEEMMGRHLENLVNYEVTLLYQTELDDYDLVKKIELKYPKTLSRMSFNFTPFYKDFDVTLVDECIVEKLNSLGAENFEIERNQPSLRFEYFIQREAKEKARKLFNDFVSQN